MKAGNGPHFEQSYNAQAAVDAQMGSSGASQRGAQRHRGVGADASCDQSGAGDEVKAV